MLKNVISYGFIQKIVVLYLVIWTISPPLQIDSIYRLLALGCAAIWFVIWVIRNHAVEFDKDEFIALIFLCLVLVVVLIEKTSFSVVLKQIAMIMLVMCYIMNREYEHKWDELSGIVPIVLILLIIWNGKTVVALVEDPTIARRLVRDDETIYEFMRQGVGGYGLIYPQVCICPVVYAWIYKSFKHNKLYFIIGVVWLISFMRFLNLAGYSIALFTAFVGFFMLVFYKGKSGAFAIILTAGVFIAIMATILYLTDFREWLLEIFDGTAVAKKINDLVSTSETGETGESIQVRINAYSGSLFDIFKYPLIGSLWRESGGGHSAFLDIFSKYGIFGGVIFSKTFYCVPIQYKNKYNDRFITSVTNALLTTLVFVSFFDSFSYMFTGMILLVAPLFIEDLVRWRKAEKI